MPGLLREVLSTTIRGEMRRRVDEVLKSGEKWVEASNKLTTELKRLNTNIEQGTVKPDLISSIKKPIFNLSKKTTKLTKAFNAYQKTLGKIATQVKE